MSPGRTLRVKSERTETCRCESAEDRGCRGRIERRPVDAFACRANDAVLELTRAPGVDQLSAECAQQGLRNRRQPELTHSPKLADRGSDHRITREAAQELRVVVVDREYEAQALEPLFSLRAQDHASVDELPRGRQFNPVADSQSRGEAPVAHVAGRVVRVSNAKCERVRPGRPDYSLEHQSRGVILVSDSSPSLAARSVSRSASSSRPRSGVFRASDCPGAGEVRSRRRSWPSARRSEP